MIVVVRPAFGYLWSFVRVRLDARVNVSGRARVTVRSSGGLDVSAHLQSERAGALYDNPRKIRGKTNNPPSKITSYVEQVGFPTSTGVQRYVLLRLAEKRC